MYTDKQSIELFHLLFLRVLKTQLDSSLYVLKGGCNLRFFFESIRYSEDIDLDVHTISLLTLKKKVDNVLNRSPLHQTLASYGIEIVQVSSPKQTQTVQRWKVGIKPKNRAIVIPTKVEFSRRDIESERAAEPIGNFILQSYQLPQIILPHYLLGAAIRQKIFALVERKETQARDIFDLYLLFSKSNEFTLISFNLEKAIDCVLNISFNDFSSQVVSYLAKEYIEYYRNPAIFEEIQLSVIDNLKKYYKNEIDRN